MAQLAGLSALVWPAWGLSVALVNILTSLDARQHERGKVFGVLGMTTGLGSVVGGAAFGPIADRWGYPTMFAAAALAMLAALLAIPWLHEEKRGRIRHGGVATSLPAAKLGFPFTLLFLAALCVAIGYYVGVLSVALAMNMRGFSAADISRTGIAAGLVGMTLPFVVGPLSDRVGRKAVLLICYPSIAASLLILIWANSLWHFWLSLGLRAVIGSTLSMGSAFAADLLPRPALPAALSRLGAATWIGGVVGFAATGYAIQHLGLTFTLGMAAALLLIAIALVGAIRRPASDDGPAGDRPSVTS
jgi:MFS family permease